MYTVDDEAASSGMTKENSRAAYCLVLPGKTLYLTPLLNIKKFRAHGNKDGAVTAFFQLQEENLGKICVIGNSRANPVSIIYQIVP